MDEIPLAKREVTNRRRNKKLLTPKLGEIVTIGISVLLILSLAGIISNFVFSLFANQPIVRENQTEQIVTLEQNPDNIASENLPETSQGNQSINHILGHLSYEEAPAEELKPITRDGGIKLRINAANKFLDMQRVAKEQGVSLVPISGFRNVSEQEYLFFRVKEQRKQGAAERAEVSAPPGYSEHHTGYAIDIGDGNAPATNLKVSFEETSAYRWLAVNAPRYSFELSFPRDNLQGISYEPWHWRFVGDSHSLKTFYQARELTNNLRINPEN